MKAFVVVELVNAEFVVKKFVVVAFVAVKLVMMLVTASRSEEKSDVVVAFVATKEVAVVVARVDVPFTVRSPFNVSTPAVEVPMVRDSTYPFVVVEFPNTEFVAKRLVEVALVARSSPNVEDAATREATYAFVVVELVSIASVSVEDAATRRVI